MDVAYISRMSFYGLEHSWLNARLTRRRTTAYAQGVFIIEAGVRDRLQTSLLEPTLPFRDVSLLDDSCSATAIFNATYRITIRLLRLVPRALLVLLLPVPPGTLLSLQTIFLLLCVCLLFRL